MGNYRFNVIDEEGTASFLGPRHGSKMIAAACGANHRSLSSLLTYIRALDDVWATEVESGLRAFDERNGETEAETPMPDPESGWKAPFRVVDSETRRQSMKISSLGLFVVNLKARRIVQVDNRSHSLEKSGKGRVRRNGRPTRMLFRYDLPAEWDLVP
ncbi:MAG TPA: hypothetical protein VGR22_08115 [Thermomicrobiales bacterium]|nr:hypothetical protein [Thermomicrobiales bacterium]